MALAGLRRSAPLDRDFGDASGLELECGEPLFTWLKRCSWLSVPISEDAKAFWGYNSRPMMCPWTGEMMLPGVHRERFERIGEFLEVSADSLEAMQRRNLAMTCSKPFISMRTLGVALGAQLTNGPGLDAEDLSFEGVLAILPPAALERCLVNIIGYVHCEQINGAAKNMAHTACIVEHLAVRVTQVYRVLRDREVLNDEQHEALARQVARLDARAQEFIVKARDAAAPISFTCDEADFATVIAMTARTTGKSVHQSTKRVSDGSVLGIALGKTFVVDDSKHSGRIISAVLGADPQFRVRWN